MALSQEGVQAAGQILKSNSPPNGSDTWIRTWKLIIGSIDGKRSQIIGEDAKGNPLDLRIRFEVHQTNIQTPNYAIITVYNLSPDTAANIVAEFDQVTLEVGYQNGKFGTIFSGTVKMYERGHESVVDSFLRIYANDGDKILNYGTMNEITKPGTTNQQIMDRLQAEADKQGASKGYVDPKAIRTDTTPQMRHGLLLGMWADEMRLYGQRNGAVWSINDGKLTFGGNISYDPGDVVTLDGTSGLVGWPTETTDGIIVTAFINPAIRLRQRIKLDNKQINQFNVPGPGEKQASFVQWPGFKDQLTYSNISTDGTYTPIEIQYAGDTRGNEWYMTMVCVVVDESLPRENAVKPGMATGLPAGSDAATDFIIPRGGT